MTTRAGPQATPVGTPSSSTRHASGPRRVVAPGGPAAIRSGPPEAPRVGLYDPQSEHDACGVALVADLQGRRTHTLVRQALSALEHLAHRGATGSEEDSGDGAGILIQVPHDFYTEVVDFDLPGRGGYATGIAFLSRNADEARSARTTMEKLADEEGLQVIGWRQVPIDDTTLGSISEAAMPSMHQLFVAPSTGTVLIGDDTALAIDRLAFVLRKRAEHEIDDCYVASLSARTITYKGMLTSHQLAEFFPDLSDERVISGLALVHSRFSTNTFPSWPLAHPYRYLAHNGEINTLAGNRNWMRAREALCASPLIPGLERAFPIVTPGASDSASFDEVLELLHLGGRPLHHAVLMMIPEAWENHRTMDPARRAFYRYHASLMEPWDGPAAVAFTDGTVIGAVLDRNGLRPARYWVTDDGMVVLASEVGVIDVPADKVVRKGRLQPGRMFLVDTEAGRIVDDDEIKEALSRDHPYAEWLDDGQIELEDLPPRLMLTPQHASVVGRQRLFGYTNEELRLILQPMARSGAEPLGSMGTDTAIAVLSDRPRLLYDYFTQLFAQVTNPPLDAIREELVTSLLSSLGPEANLLEPTAESCRQIVLPMPVIDNDDLAKLLYVNEDGSTPGFRAFAIDGLFEVSGGGEALRAAIEDVRSKVSAAIADGADVIVLSDRNSTAELAPIPSLLLVSAVHHHLVREKTRTRVGLVVESGDAREVHHMALLKGFGAAAINPYLAFETLDDMIASGILTGVTPRQAQKNYIKAASKGIIKVMSKMGISTVASYTGAQVFEAVGLAPDIIDEYFSGTVSRIGGVGLDVLADEVAQRHRLSHLDRPTELAHREREVGGEYQWRREGEIHLFNPKTVFKLQHATRSKRYEVFKEYTRAVDEQSAHLATLRGLMHLRTGGRAPIPLDEVEPVESIVARFSTGAMSYGSISAEAHETLAVAMNRIGGKSNTGEGGEDPDRFTPDANGDLRRSAIKQVASGRFGVTSEYLVNADDIQIKIAQGAKPGEGGQLPGHKVSASIAKTRYSTPGVGLISPPPHHDIYSIEDIAQLIHDLKSANPRARVHVKLVAEVGVGTVAAGVAKAHSDVVLISGHDGGTGATPLTSQKHAGIPWELGLAETQQTLLANDLRDRIVVQVDGQLKTGRDVLIGALLGAEEFGFATAPLVVSGCIMMRVCHLDTCPVGIATQNPALRARFTGRPEFVETFFEYIAEEVRELLASLGLRTLEEAVGRVDLIDTSAAVEHWKARGLDLAPILVSPPLPEGAVRYCINEQDHGLDRALDHEFLEQCRPAIESGVPVRAEVDVTNVNRTVGTLLGYEITRRHGGRGLPEGTIDITFRGSAGQSFGAFLPKGVTMRLLGDTNDYLGKGLSGGRIIVRPPHESTFAAEENIVAGNVILYGATGGEVFLRGQVGERFCVRNSGAIAVVEGVGDHGCEYMTGGRVVVLGPTGRNFAAGMSGGMAFVYDPHGLLVGAYNRELVELEPLSADDRVWLKDRITMHQTETGSEVARAILSDWISTSEQFVTVMPQDYRRVLEATERAVAEGRSVEEAVMEASHG
jgi:glutamate synthase (NADPH/NADH) large chain